jgi:hypothetical protein
MPSDDGERVGDRKDVNVEVADQAVEWRQADGLSRRHQQNATGLVGAKVRAPLRQGRQHTAEALCPSAGGLADRPGDPPVVRAEHESGGDARRGQLARQVCERPVRGH